MSNPPLLPPEDSFDLTIKLLLIPNSPIAYTLLPTIQRFLSQYHLSPRVEVKDILFEAYLRGKARIAQGEVIESPIAWLRRTCHNIVREKSRKLAKQQPSAPEQLDLFGKTTHEKQVGDDLLEGRLEILFKAFVRFKLQDPEGAELLELNVCQNLPWSEVRNCLLDRGKNPPNVEGLRQQGCRARKKLRRLYHEIEQESA